jgi:hypothetical protein
MVDPKKLSRNVLTFTVEPNTIEVLVGPLDSYKERWDSSPSHVTIRLPWERQGSL